MSLQPMLIRDDRNTLLLIHLCCKILLQNGILNNFSVLYITAMYYTRRADMLTGTNLSCFCMISVWD